MLGTYNLSQKEPAKRAAERVNGFDIKEALIEKTLLNVIGIFRKTNMAKCGNG